MNPNTTKNNLRIISATSTRGDISVQSNRHPNEQGSSYLPQSRSGVADHSKIALAGFAVLLINNYLIAVDIENNSRPLFYSFSELLFSLRRSTQ